MSARIQKTYLALPAAVVAKYRPRRKSRHFHRWWWQDEIRVHLEEPSAEWLCDELDAREAARVKYGGYASLTVFCRQNGANSTHWMWVNNNGGPRPDGHERIWFENERRYARWAS